MKNIETGEVYTFKLMSGEELIAKVINVGDSAIELASPLSVAPNHQGMGLIPSMFTADQDKNVELNTNSITMYAPSVDSIRLKYIEATTGIATTSKKLILG
jgi:hypothetical protein